MFKPKIFRDYDIRGVVGTDFDEQLAFQLGQAYGSLVRETFPTKKSLTVGVGYDCRLTNTLMSGALSNGIRAVGVNVLDTGMGATPQLYFSVFHRDLDGGIQVTASHNPSDQNGFKMMVGKKTLSGKDIYDLRSRVEKLDQGGKATSAEQGSIEKWDAQSAYLAELIERSRSHMGKRKLKVVADAGNGVGAPVGPQLLRALGCEVIELYTEPDGRFPNHHPDPTVLENIQDMIKLVRETKADLGIAWDGDADRIGVVDENGEAIFGDMLLVIFGRQLLSEVKNPTIIGDVKCSELMFKDLSARGANTVMSRTGHSFIKAKLQELGAELGGEMSGHMFFKHRYFGFDDAIHASGRIVEILSNTDKKMSELLDGIPKTFSTPEIRVDTPEEVKFQVAEKAKTLFPEYETNPLDGVRIMFPKGWGLVRASNTQPALVMRFEAETQALLEEYQTLVETRIKKLEAELLGK
ncbi:MAG: phosphomannomutase/phosphoglucomutase [Deltaproteobacteria bacterium]|nr:phosphomannomutase/phosphoglucomutase [Deltaproteobacteria bacterium]